MRVTFRYSVEVSVTKFTIGIVVAYAAIVLLLLPSRLSVPTTQTFLDDARNYHTIATRIVQQGIYSEDGIHKTSEREPGYPVFLSIVYRIFGVGNRTAIFAVQAVVYAAAALFFLREFAYYISKRVLQICALLLFLEPAVFHLIFFVYRELLAMAVFLCVLGLSLRMLRKPGWIVCIALGVTLGFAVLTYMPLAPLIIVLPALLWYLCKDWKRSLIVFALSSMCVGGWALRNAQSSDTSSCLLGGCGRAAVAWYVRARQSEQLSIVEPARCLWGQYISHNWNGRAEACRFAVAVSSGVQWYDPASRSISQRESIVTILRHPVRHVWISLFWFLEFHLPYVNGWGAVYNTLEAAVTLILYAGIALLAFKRTWKREWLLFIVPIVVVAATFALLDVEPRYRMPVIGCYTALASMGFAGAKVHPPKHT